MCYCELRSFSAHSDFAPNVRQLALWRTNILAPTMEIDPNTGRIQGGAFFTASFGVGGYNAFTCIDFAGEGFTLVCFMYKTL